MFGSLFEDLLFRMIVTVSVLNFAIWYGIRYGIRGKGKPSQVGTVILLGTIVLLISIVIQIWFVVVYLQIT
jgi:hypothetical protein